MIKVKTFLLSALLVGLTLSAQTITFTCQTVATSVCASGYQWRTQGTYEGNNLDNYYCVATGNKCNAKVSSINLQTCKIDYKNNACSTGVCFTYPQSQVVTTTETCGTTEVPKSYNVSYKCDTCSTVANCTKCFFKTTN